MSVAKSIIIYVYSLKMQLLFTFPSYLAAVQYFNPSKNTLRKYVCSHHIFRDKYVLSLELLSSDFIPIKTNSWSYTIYVYSLDYQLLHTFPSSNITPTEFFNVDSKIILNYAAKASEKNSKIYIIYLLRNYHLLPLIHQSLNIFTQLNKYLSLTIFLLFYFF